jgi:hypothetical protein
VIRAMLIAVLLALNSMLGCAADNAAKAGIEVVGKIGQTLVEKANLTDFSASAGGHIHSPHYRGTVGYVQGIMYDFGLDGVEVDGQITGMGSGPDKPLTPETIAAMRVDLVKTGMGEKLADAAIEVLKAKFATTQPVPDDGQKPK